MHQDMGSVTVDFGAASSCTVPVGATSLTAPGGNWQVNFPEKFRKSHEFSLKFPRIFAETDRSRGNCLPMENRSLLL